MTKPFPIAKKKGIHVYKNSFSIQSYRLLDDFDNR